ncbi:MAG TPA: lysylphosphatidylglycerol synthase domain-containing protein [Chitinophagaceae bacterium]|nr:MAG: hypothetical protein UZ11_BCD004000469 [Bacteroidetes bacterium OLB11]HMN33166.1 lysylphosphatidylglycerol synthase domain-containing protein [Chitinophagaceae bacterium]
MLNNKNIKILLKTVLGLSLFLWMAYSLYNQIQSQENLKSTIYSLFNEWSFEKVVLLITVIILMFSNWMIEAVKWKLLLKDTEEFSLSTSFQSVLTGVAVSVITPNRIGEYMGRILYLKNVNKIKGITVTIIGSFAQLIVTGFLGLIGLVYYIFFVKQSSWLYILLATSVVLCIVLTYLYFHLYKIVDWIDRYQFLRKLKIYIEVIKRFDKGILNKILFISLLRYFVYTLQFILLLRLMLVFISFPDMLFTIWLIFWAMAIVPTITIAELGVRGETALFFLSVFSSNQFGIVASSLLLWLINLIIPALIGCLFVYKMKIYEDD